MAESTLSLSYWEFRRKVAEFLGFGSPMSRGTVTSVATTTVTLNGGYVLPDWVGPDSGTLINKATGERLVVTERTGDTTLTTSTASTWTGVAYELNPWPQSTEDIIDDVIATGYRRFLNPNNTPNRKRAHEWSFLSPNARLSTVEPSTSGTVTIAAGVVTLVGGTFPAWSAGAEIVLGEGDYAGQRLDIATRGGNTEVTLQDTTIAVATATTYRVYRSAYDLPDDWTGFVTDGFTYARPSNNCYTGKVRLVGERQLRREEFGQPIACAIRPKTSTGTAGTRWEVLFDPIPDQVYLLEYRYRAVPGMMTALKPLPYGSMDHAETLMSSMLAAAEESRKDVAGLNRMKFNELLMASIELDERMSSPKTLGLDPNQFRRTGTYIDNATVAYPYESYYDPSFYHPG